MPNPKDPQKLQEYRDKQSRIAKAKGFGKWMTGRTLSTETKQKLSRKQKARCTPEECVRRSEAAKANGYGLWMKGKKLAPETVEKITAHKRGRTYEAIYGPQAEEEKLKRRTGNRKRWEGVERIADLRPYQGGSWEYTEWRTAVFEQDDYTCQDCGEKGGELNAHHIFQWAWFPLFRYLVWNGKTLCVKCHKKIKVHLFSDWTYH